MENKLVNSFEDQMKSIIYDCAFSDSAKWESHLLYMAANPDEYWINVLSVFNCRDHPISVKRMEKWKEQLSLTPIINKGSTGIPIVVKNGNVKRIVHDAWDLNDFSQTFDYSLSYPLLKAIAKVKRKYKLNYDTTFWRGFIETAVYTNRCLFRHANKDQMMNFFVSSFFYILYGEQSVDVSVFAGKEPQELCEIYRNFYKVVSKMPDRFLTIAERQGEEILKKERFQALMIRAERKLPQRIKDAEIKLGKKKYTGASSSYEPEDGIERNKFINE